MNKKESFVGGLIAILTLLLCVNATSVDSRIANADADAVYTYTGWAGIGLPGESWIFDGQWILIYDTSNGTEGDVKLLDIVSGSEEILGKGYGSNPPLSLTYDGDASWIDATQALASGRMGASFQLGRHSIASGETIITPGEGPVDPWGASPQGGRFVRKVTADEEKTVRFVIDNKIEVGPVSWQNYVKGSDDRATNYRYGYTSPRVGANGNTVTQFGIYSSNGDELFKFDGHEEYYLPKYYISPSGSKACAVLCAPISGDESVQVLIYNLESRTVEFDELFQVDIGGREVVGSDWDGSKFFLAMNGYLNLIENGSITQTSDKIYHLPLDDIRVSFDGKNVMALATSQLFKLDDNLEVVWESKQMKQQAFGMLTSEDCSVVVVGAGNELYVYRQQDDGRTEQ